MESSELLTCGTRHCLLSPGADISFAGCGPGPREVGQAFGLFAPPLASAGRFARLPITRHDPMPARARVDLNAVWNVLDRRLHELKRIAASRAWRGAPPAADIANNIPATTRLEPFIRALPRGPQATFLGTSYAPRDLGRARARTGGQHERSAGFFLLVILSLMAAAPVQGQSRPTGSDRIRPPSNYRAQRCERVYGPSFRERLKYRRSGGG
jgi:hypothetical protein